MHKTGKCPSSRSSRGRRPAVLATAVVLSAGAITAAHSADPARAAVGAVDAVEQSPLTVAAKAGGGRVFLDAHGREVTLRGFNVSASTKLYENSLLPFRSTADAATSARAMREQTGANVVRFLITWEGVQPAPGSIDTSYLDRVADQVRQFTDRGIRVFLDYHQDLYSRYVFNSGSWYTGDGAPAWVVAAGGYPQESCGICLLWGQNMLTNGAVRQAAYDFWHNRTLTTSAGQVKVQDAYLSQATSALAYLKQKLPAASFQNIIGVDPFNEPFDGGLDGKAGTEWETTYLVPFYQRFRAGMDSAGWTDKLELAEPLVFWNTAFSEAGGLSTAPAFGTRAVFNSHYYDGARMTIDFSPASDGTYDSAMNQIRDRASSLATVPLVSEFGNKLSGSGSDRTPWMVRAMYQAMDYGVTGASWWDKAASGGGVLSSTQWQWDIYSGRHHELMNGNADKVQTTGDAWNDEDFSVVTADDAGTVTPRLDARVLDRLYPSAVAGTTLAFAYEDLARSGFAGAGTEKAWLTVPSSLPSVAALTSGRQYGVLVWREPATTPDAPTELHLPQSFTTAGTVVVGDVATAQGLPASGAVAVAAEAGATSARRLLISPSGAAGTVHVALVVNASSGSTVTAAQLSAARTELTAWRDRLFGS